MSTLPPLAKTRIYQELIYKEKQGQPSFSNIIKNVVKDCDLLLPRISETFNEYTLHDSTHSINILKIMDQLIPETTFKNLNSIELSILILSAYLHDIGMLKAKNETTVILEDKDFQKFQQRFNTGLILRSSQTSYSYREITEHEDFIISEFIRKNHGKRSRQYITKHFGAGKKYGDISFVEDLGQIVESHTSDVNILVKQNESLVDLFRNDKLIQKQSVNIKFLALCLRIADIMDFDRERTPRVLYEYISPENKSSIEEWNKHLSVDGWTIENGILRYECKCSHPSYQNAVLRFLDIIESELEMGSIIIQKDKSEKYLLDLPSKIDRRYVVSDGYIYGDFQFRLDYNSIMNLLMGESLYSSYHMAIRELLQNAIDACKFRQAFEQISNLEVHDAKICVTLYEDDNDRTLIIEDNGIGMDVSIIEKYLMKVGVSYYRSREFESIRLDLKKNNVDFDPISQFGIGVLSNFMISDKFRIETSRFEKLSDSNTTKPLAVNVEGKSGFYVVKEIERNHCGTKVILSLKNNIQPNLINNVKRFLSHPEFPIIIDNKVLQSSETVADLGFKKFSIIPSSREFINDRYYKFNHEKESFSINDKISVVNIDLSQSNKHQGFLGNITLAFPKDNFGKICASNDTLGLKKLSMVEYFEYTSCNKNFAFSIMDQLLTLDEKIHFLDQYPKPRGNLQKRESDAYSFLTDIWTIDQFEMFCNDLISYLSEPKIHEEDKQKGIPSYSDYHEAIDSSGFSPKQNIIIDYVRYLKECNLSFDSESILSCDGFIVSHKDEIFGISNFGLNLPVRFDINLRGEIKVNLNAARDRVIPDDKEESFKQYVVEAIADTVYNMITKNEVTDDLQNRYKLFLYFTKSDNLMAYLLRTRNFLYSYFLLKVKTPTSMIISTIPQLGSMLENFDGKLYVGNTQTLNTHYLLQDSEEILPFILPLIGTTYHTSTNRVDRLIELNLIEVNSNNFGRRNNFIFIKYEGENKQYLYEENLVYGFNKDHLLSITYEQTTLRSDVVSSKINNLITEILNRIHTIDRHDSTSNRSLEKTIVNIKRDIAKLKNINAKYNVDERLDGLDENNIISSNQ